MTGGTRAHADIQANLAAALRTRLRGKPCQFYGSDLKIRTADDHIRYSDGFVTCTGGENASTIVSDPVVIFEVLSPSTAAMDRIIKAREYQAMPSVKRYVMLEQDRIGATAYTRASDDWKHEVLIEGFHSRSSGDRRRAAARGALRRPRLRGRFGRRSAALRRVRLTLRQRDRHQRSQRPAGDDPKVRESTATMKAIRAKRRFGLNAFWSRSG